MSTVGLLPIPWNYVDAGLARWWVWGTEHFEAKVSAEGNSFAWEIGDKIVPSQGLPRFLCEGRTGDFGAAESAVREAVGKSYPSLLGYGPYIGALATTFTIADGSRVNLGEFDGQPVVVVVRVGNGLTRQIMGEGRVVHWEYHVDQSGSVLAIQPSHIESIKRESGAGVSAASSAYTGLGRVYRGEVSVGCTGTPGFQPGVVDHSGPTCPIHEVRTGR